MEEVADILSREMEANLPANTTNKSGFQSLKQRLKNFNLYRASNQLKLNNRTAFRRRESHPTIKTKITNRTSIPLIMISNLKEVEEEVITEEDNKLATKEEVEPEEVEEEAGDTNNTLKTLMKVPKTFLSKGNLKENNMRQVFIWTKITLTSSKMEIIKIGARNCKLINQLSTDKLNILALHLITSMIQKITKSSYLNTKKRLVM